MAKKKRTTYHVVPRAEGWAVKRAGASRANCLHKKKQSAIECAKLHAKEHVPGQVIVHTADDTIETEYTYGDDPRNIPG